MNNRIQQALHRRANTNGQYKKKKKKIYCLIRNQRGKKISVNCHVTYTRLRKYYKSGENMKKLEHLHSSSGRINVTTL